MIKTGEQWQAQRGVECPTAPRDRVMRVKEPDTAVPIKLWNSLTQGTFRSQSKTLQIDPDPGPGKGPNGPPWYSHQLGQLTRAEKMYLCLESQRKTHVFKTVEWGLVKLRVLYFLLYILARSLLLNRQMRSTIMTVLKKKININV